MVSKLVAALLVIVLPKFTRSVQTFIRVGRAACAAHTDTVRREELYENAVNSVLL